VGENAHVTFPSQNQLLSCRGAKRVPPKVLLYN
jgi:hypothetical protein